MRAEAVQLLCSTLTWSGDDAHGNSQVLSSPAESEDSQLLQQIHMAFIAYGGVTSVEAAAVVAALLAARR